MSEPWSHADIDATIEWLRGNEQRNYNAWLYQRELDMTRSAKTMSDLPHWLYAIAYIAYWTLLSVALWVVELYIKRRKP